MGYDAADDQPEGYGGWIVYHESAGSSDQSFEDWLTKYRPSKKEWGNQAWISVSAKDNNDTAFTEDSANQAKAAGDQASIKAAIKAEHEVETKSVEIANEIAAKVKEIEEDASIPTRASKKNPISKKVARDQAHKHAAERLKNLATDSKLTSGKWLFYIAVDNIDAVWEKIARAIVEEKGPLRGKVYSAKVSTWEPDRVGEEGNTHVICVYVSDSWNAKLVGDVFEILVRRLGLVSNAYKADVYTYAGIDSKHSSKMKSTLYNKKDFMTDEQITQAIEDRKKPVDADGKPKEVEVVKKQAKGTGFVDDDSDSDATEKSGDEQPKKKAKSSA